MRVPGMRPRTDCQIQVVSSSSHTHTNTAKRSEQAILINRNITMKGNKGYDFKREQGGIYGSALREQRDREMM